MKAMPMNFSPMFGAAFMRHRDHWFELTNDRAGAVPAAEILDDLFEKRGQAYILNAANVTLQGIGENPFSYDSSDYSLVLTGEDYAEFQQNSGNPKAQQAQIRNLFASFEINLAGDIEITPISEPGIRN